VVDAFLFEARLFLAAPRTSSARAACPGTGGATAPRSASPQATCRDRRRRRWRFSSSSQRDLALSLAAAWSTMCSATATAIRMTYGAVLAHHFLFWNTPCPSRGIPCACTAAGEIEDLVALDPGGARNIEYARCR